MININPKIKEALSKLNIKELKPVQKETIPQLGKSKDVVVQSPTGTGKTLAFVIPIVDNINTQYSCFNHKKVHSLIITPTRELALQINDVFKSFNVTTMCFIGRNRFESKNNTDYKKNKNFKSSFNKLNEKVAESSLENKNCSEELLLKEFEKMHVNVIIGTPGRLSQIITQFKIKFSDIKFLILDEADKLLNLGFENTLQKILSLLPKERVTGLFTATLDNSIVKLGKLSLRNPVTITIDDKKIIPDKLKLEFVIQKPFEKIYGLLNYLRKNKCIVFFSTCAAVEYFYDLFCLIQKKFGERLEINHVNFYKIHGKIKNEERQTVYDDFLNNGNALFCTDIAARGIDFKDIDYVIQFDAPLDPSNFIHRSGRTARNGDEGRCVLFLMLNEVSFINYLKIKGVEVKNIAECGQIINTDYKYEEDKTQDTQIGKKLIETTYVGHDNINILKNENKVGVVNESTNIDSEIQFNTTKMDFIDLKLENRYHGNTEINNFNVKKICDILDSNKKIDQDKNYNIIQKNVGIGSTNKKTTDLTESYDLMPKYDEIKNIFDANMSKKSLLAFISYIRSYKEYCLSYIFNLKELNFDSTISLFFLDKVPQMNELQNVNFKRFKRPDNKTNKAKRLKDMRMNRKYKK